MEKKPRVTAWNFFVYGQFWTLFATVLVLFVVFAVSFVVEDDIMKGPSMYRHDFYNALQGKNTELTYEEPHARATGAWLHGLPLGERAALMQFAYETAIVTQNLSAVSREEYVRNRMKDSAGNQAQIVGALEKGAFYEIAVGFPDDAILKRILSGEIVPVRQEMDRLGSPLQRPFQPIPAWIFLVALQIPWTLAFLNSHTKDTEGDRYDYSSGMRRPYWRNFAWGNPATYLIFVMLFPFGDAVLLIAWLVTSSKAKAQAASESRKQSPAAAFSPEQAAAETRKMLERAEARLRS